MRHLPWFVVLASVACGGVVSPPNGDAADALDASDADVEEDAATGPLTCRIGSAAFAFIACASLPDGGPTFLDDGTDCRTFAADGGEACVLGASCTAWRDTAGFVSGTCEPEP